ncbi:MAG: DUF1475 family protein [Clostridium sp.]
MNKLKWFFLVGAISMAIAIIYGLTIGDFTGDGKILLGLYWGSVTMLDIYLAFISFSIFMFYREGINIKSIILFILILVLGSFTICLYTFLAMHESKGDWNKLFSRRSR